MEDQLFEVYVRNEDGDTHFTDIRTGLKEFLDDDNGYRLTINIEGIKITLRRGIPAFELRELDSFIYGQRSVDCAVTIITKEVE